jgi:short-subunit dehydrogenase
MSPRKKSILITGASRGLGKELAIAYAQTSTQLILLARDKGELEETAKRCIARGAEVSFASIDILDREALQNFITQNIDAHGIDLVIANAGVASTLSKGWAPEDSRLERSVLDTNISGTVNVLNPIIHHMIHRREGHIAVVSSLAGYVGLPQAPSYCASKAALNSYCNSLRAWLKRYSIYVTVICPGYMDTAMSQKLLGYKILMIAPDKAARKIKVRLEKKKKSINFPLALYYLVRLSQLLPGVLFDKITGAIEVYQKEQ